MPYSMQSPGTPVYRSPSPVYGQSPYYSGGSGDPSGVAIAGLVVACVTAVCLIGVAGGWWNRYGRPCKGKQ